MEDPEYFRKQEQARRDQKRTLKAASGDATKPMTLTAAAAAAAAAPSPQPELLLGADAGVDEQKLEDLADALTHVKGVKIVGNSREIYINAGAWSPNERKIPLTQPNAGHVDSMESRWKHAFKNDPSLRPRAIACVNSAAVRVVEHLKQTIDLPEKAIVSFNSPSFLMAGDGGIPHVDAVHEYQCLMAMVCGAPTKVFSGTCSTYPAGITTTEFDLLATRQKQYVKTHAPLFLTRAELEPHMTSVGGVSTVRPGDIALLPPGHVHETPKALGTVERCMLFFTVLVQVPGEELPPLYDPLHQVMPFDAVSKLVTHNFFPNRQPALIDLLTKAHFDWSSHLRYAPAFVNRIVETAPDVNAKNAIALRDAVKAVLDACNAMRKKTKNAPWKVCDA